MNQYLVALISCIAIIAGAWAYNNAGRKRHTPNLPTVDDFGQSSPLLIFSFLKRYWFLNALFVLLVIAGHYDECTYFVGPLFYLIEIAIGILTVTLFLKHVGFRKTLDTFTWEEGGTSPFIRAWEALPDREKLYITLAVHATMFVGISWVAANIVK